VPREAASSGGRCRWSVVCICKVESRSQRLMASVAEASSRLTLDEVVERDAE